MRPMIDWIYRDCLLVCNGKLYKFTQPHADIINLLLIAEGRVSVRDLFEMMQPEDRFSLAREIFIYNQIKKINSVFAAIGWKIMHLGQHSWIERGVGA